MGLELPKSQSTASTLTTGTIEVYMIEVYFVI